MKISYILDSVDSGTVVLPEFQRGYVWSRDQVKGLIQSLYQRFPVGGLLIWNTRADTTDLRGSSVSGAETVKLLLDGQQRVTSLYGVLRGRPPQFFEDPERAHAFTGLHFHLDLEEFAFHQPSKMAGDPLWISVTELMLQGPQNLTAAVGQLGQLDHDRLFLYVNRLQALHGIRDIDLHDENLSGEEMTVDVVVDIFNRVNSGGTKLSRGDLALARICAQRPAAREELRGAIARWQNAGFDFGLDWLLRCVNVVVTGEARFEALKNVSAEDFGVGLKKTEQAIDFVLNLLATRLGLDHDRVLMGRYGIPAMVRLVVEKGGSITDLQDQNNLLFWYIHQAAWGRYSGSTESVLDRDLAAIEEDGIEGLIREMELSRGSLVIRPDDFNTQTVGSRFYPILYMLTRVNDAQDLCSGLPLSAHLLGKGSRLEVHHIFPKGVLYGADFSRKEVNAVANFAFLTGDCNRKLGMRKPEDYFAEVDSKHVGALASQWITDDQALWDVDHYLGFLADRRVRLAEATNALLDGLREGSAPTEVAGSAGGEVEEPSIEDDLEGLSDWCASLGLARPDIPAEIVDTETGEALVYADAGWSEGMQVGRSQRIALVLERDEETEARLSELDYRFFTDIRGLRHYVEELLNLDLDGDGVIGAPEAEEPRPVGGPRTWYVNFGGSLGRQWEDARRYNFVSAGGGVWYSKPLLRISPGDRLLVYLPQSGYAGIATATRAAAPFADAIVDIAGEPTRIGELAMAGGYEHDTGDADPGEYVVSVDWEVVVDREDAFWSSGLFSNQATTVELSSEVERHAQTIEAVLDHFGADSAPDAAVPAAADDLLTEALTALGPPGERFSDAATHAPATPGLYAIYADVSVWSELGLTNPAEDRPLYVGKSDTNVLNRDVNDHFATGRTGWSTLRRSLAALLVDRLELVAQPRTLDNPSYFDKYGLEPEGDARLTEWMRQHLRLSIWPAPSGAEVAPIEATALAQLAPALNLERAQSPWRVEVRAARARMAAAAQSWSAGRS